MQRSSRELSRELVTERVEQGLSPALKVISPAGFSPCGTSVAKAERFSISTAGLKACSTPPVEENPRSNRHIYENPRQECTGQRRRFRTGSGYGPHVGGAGRQGRHRGC